MTAIALTINVRDVPSSPLPAELQTRLEGSPKTPEELAIDLAAHAEKSAKLRQAHLDAVRDRAHRESQRASEAVARKLRLAANKADKVLRKLEQAETKTCAKKAAADADREARKVRREAMALAVSEARAEASKMRAARQSELLEKGHLAFAKHSKVVREVAQKNAWQVKHAMAVVEAQKEKERLQAQEAGEKLALKLENAATKRAGSADVSPRTSRQASPSRVRSKVLHEVRIASEMRRRLHEASMEAHASKREAYMQKNVLEKAKHENAKAAAVVAATAAKQTGTDDATMEAKTALFQKLTSADVARQNAIRLKATPKGKGDTVSAITVKLDHLKLRMPPPHLSLRLSTVGCSLLTTAAARQAGAAARRLGLKHAALLKVAKAKERHARALANVGKLHATAKAKASAVHQRSLISVALAEGLRLHQVHSGKKKQADATRRVHEHDEARKLAGAAFQAKCDQVNERRTATIAKVAKTAVFAGRHVAFKSRREAQRAVALAGGAKAQSRCAAAHEKRAALLAAKVECARKRTVALHPKHEAADMEIKEVKEASSEA